MAQLARPLALLGPVAQKRRLIFKDNGGAEGLESEGKWLEKL
jgi:hypothetical protein